MNKSGRKTHLEELKNEKRTMIFYEAPHKLIYTLKDMYEYYLAKAEEFASDAEETPAPEGNE